MSSRMQEAAKDARAGYPMLGSSPTGDSFTPFSDLLYRATANALADIQQTSLEITSNQKLPLSLQQQGIALAQVKRYQKGILEKVGLLQEIAPIIDDAIHAGIIVAAELTQIFSDRTPLTEEGKEMLQGGYSNTIANIQTEIRNALLGQDVEPTDTTAILAVVATMLNSGDIDAIDSLVTFLVSSQRLDNLRLLSAVIACCAATDNPGFEHTPSQTPAENDRLSQLINQINHHFPPHRAERAIITKHNILQILAQAGRELSAVEIGQQLSQAYPDFRQEKHIHSIYKILRELYQYFQSIERSLVLDMNEYSNRRFYYLRLRTEPRLTQRLMVPESSASSLDSLLQEKQGILINLSNEEADIVIRTLFPHAENTNPPKHLVLLRLYLTAHSPRRRADLLEILGYPSRIKDAHKQLGQRLLDNDFGITIASAPVNESIDRRGQPLVYWVQSEAYLRKPTVDESIPENNSTIQGVAAIPDTDPNQLDKANDIANEIKYGDDQIAVFIIHQLLLSIEGRTIAQILNAYNEKNSQGKQIVRSAVTSRLRLITSRLAAQGTYMVISEEKIPVHKRRAAAPVPHFHLEQAQVEGNRVTNVIDRNDGVDSSKGFHTVNRPNVNSDLSGAYGLLDITPPSNELLTDEKQILLLLPEWPRVDSLTGFNPNELADNSEGLLHQVRELNYSMVKFVTHANNLLRRLGSKYEVSWAVLDGNNQKYYYLIDRSLLEPTPSQPGTKMQRISNFQIPDHVEESRYIVNFQAEADNQTRGTKRIRVMKLISILLNAYYLSKNSIYPDINSPKLSVESLLSRYNYPNDTTAARRTIRGDIAAINSILRKSMVPLEVIINGNGEESEVWLQQLYASAENGRNRIAANLDSLKMNLTSLPLLSLIFDEFLGKPFSYREVAAALLKKQLPSANPTQEELTNLASQIESVLTSGASTYDQTLLGLESDSEAGESRYVVISTDEIVDTDDIDAYLSDMSTVVSSMESTLKALIQRVGSIVNVSDARRFANGNRSFKVDTSLALRIVRFRTGYTLLMRYVTSESEPIDEESISSIQNKMLYDEEGKFRHWVPLLPLYANLHNTALRLGFKSAEVMFTLMENGLYNQQLQIINQQRVSQNE